MKNEEKTNKNIFGKAKDRIVLMDKRTKLIVLAVVALIILIVALVLLLPRTEKCKQTFDINGITNVNTVKIKHRGDKIIEVETTFDYELTKKGKTADLDNIKKSLGNLGKVYERIDGVTFEGTKSTDNGYQAVQVVNFDEISKENLAKVGIERSYEKARKNYVASGYTCK